MLISKNVFKLADVKLEIWHLAMCVMFSIR